MLALLSTRLDVKSSGCAQWFAPSLHSKNILGLNLRALAVFPSGNPDKDMHIKLAAVVNRV